MNPTMIAMIGLLVVGLAVGVAPTAAAAPEDCHIGYHEGAKAGNVDTGEICVVSKSTWELITSPTGQ